jgi:DNA-binding transcriptional ArsR family regulator
MDPFSALSDHTRRDILELLAKEGELPASAIYNKFAVSHPAISQHLKVLREAHLVDVEKKAQQRIYRISPEPMQKMESWMHQMTTVWERRFDALEKVLAAEKKKHKRSNSF